MPEIKLPIIQGDRVSQNIDYRDALNVNLVAIPRKVLGTEGYLLTHSGLEQFGAGKGIDRGGVWNERMQIHFRVSGGSLLRVESDGSFTELGTIPGTQQVSLPYSFNSQAIIADGRYFRYTEADGLVEVIDPDLGSPIDGVWVDGFYFFTDGEFLFHTLITDEESIDTLDYATSELSPDPTIAVDLDFDNTVMAFNRYTVEYFANDASDNFAFSRIQRRAKSFGLIGTHAKSSIDRGWIIIGGRKEEQATVYFFTPSQEQKIATREIDLILDEYSEKELSEAIVETRQEDDIQLALIRLPRHTLLYNHTITKAQGLKFAWSVLRSTISTDGVWPGINGVYDPRISAWIYGDLNGVRFGKLNRDIATIYDNEIETILYSPMVKFERTSLDEIEMETISGDPTMDAKVFVSITYDGVTFGKEYAMDYGTPYSREKRFIRYRFGYVSDFAGLKFRSVTKSKLSFANLMVRYG